MGTGRTPRRKAQEDYRKRTRAPRGVEPSEATFVFVTPRRWAAKEEWAQERRAQHHWRDVRVLDADDLEGWLRTQHTLHVRFSRRLGLRPDHIEPLDLWWRRWSQQTDPPLPAALLLAGRTDQAADLRKRLSGKPSSIGVRAATRHEALAFAAAALLHPDGGGPNSTRALVVDSAAAWADCLAGHDVAILVPTFEGADIAGALRAGHPVLPPMGAEDPVTTVELPRIGRLEAGAVFENMGMGSTRADRLAVRARRSLTSLRRGLALDPRHARPAWSQDRDADILAVLVLAGAWSANHEADQSTVSELANDDYGAVPSRRPHT